MAKVSAKKLVELLQKAGANTEDIPTLVMISFYESNLESSAENTNTKSIGLFQINANRHFKDGKPDNTLSSFAGKDITLEEFERKLKDPQYNAEFAVHYLKVIREDLEDGSSQFGMVREANNDPFGIWEAYSDYVLPYLSGEMPAGRGDNADEKKSDVVAGINSYVDAYYTLGMETNNNEPVVEETQTNEAPPEPTPEPSGIGQERREEGYSEREIVSFKRGVDKIAGMMNKVNPQHPEAQRQASLYLANVLGMDVQSIPIDVRSNYDEVDTVILNFVGELGKAKAR